MTTNQLKQDIIDEITFSGALPNRLNDKELGRIIRIASEYFYDNWRHACEPRYLKLPRKLFRDEVFRKTRQIRLPDCVRFVHDLKEPTGGSIFGTIDRDFSEQKFIGAEVFLTPFMGESIMYRTIMFSFLDLTKGLIKDTIAFDYNKNTHILSIIGGTPRLDAVCQVAKTIELEDLYEDELFQRYVRAKAKMRMGELLQTYTFTLPGGSEINYSITVEKAEKEFEAILDQMKGENTTDWMFLYRQ
jgi:hypothetical protein